MLGLKIVVGRAGGRSGEAMSGCWWHLPVVGHRCGISVQNSWYMYGDIEVGKRRKEIRVGYMYIGEKDATWER